MKKIKYILPLLAMIFEAHAAKDISFTLTRNQRDRIEKAIDDSSNKNSFNLTIRLTGNQMNSILKEDKSIGIADEIINLENNSLCLIYDEKNIKKLKELFKEGDAFDKSDKINKMFEKNSEAIKNHENLVLTEESIEDEIRNIEKDNNPLSSIRVGLKILKDKNMVLFYPSGFVSYTDAIFSEC